MAQAVLNIYLLLMSLGELRVGFALSASLFVEIHLLPKLFQQTGQQFKSFESHWTHQKNEELPSIYYLACVALDWSSQLPFPGASGMKLKKQISQYSSPHLLTSLPCCSQGPLNLCYLPT